jgi:hypothetical protein
LLGHEPEEIWLNDFNSTLHPRIDLALILKMATLIKTNFEGIIVFEDRRFSGQVNECYNVRTPVVMIERGLVLL